jgi:hypothetical protein
LLDKRIRASSIYVNSIIGDLFYEFDYNYRWSYYFVSAEVNHLIQLYVCRFPHVYGLISNHNGDLGTKRLQSKSVPFLQTDNSDQNQNIHISVIGSFYVPEVSVLTSRLDSMDVSGAIPAQQAPTTPQHWESLLYGTFAQPPLLAQDHLGQKARSVCAEEGLPQLLAQEPVVPALATLRGQSQTESKHRVATELTEEKRKYTEVLEELRGNPYDPSLQLRSEEQFGEIQRLEAGALRLSEAFKGRGEMVSQERAAMAAKKEAAHKKQADRIAQIMEKRVESQAALKAEMVQAETEAGAQQSAMLVDGSQEEGEAESLAAGGACPSAEVLGLEA